jgi:hypothetical protein
MSLSVGLKDEARSKKTKPTTVDLLAPILVEFIESHEPAKGNETSLYRWFESVGLTRHPPRHPRPREK